MGLVGRQLGAGQADVELVGGQVLIWTGGLGANLTTDRKGTSIYGDSWATGRKCTGMYGDCWWTGWIWIGRCEVSLVTYRR